MNNLNKIINLIKKTGDKFVIMDEDGASFVVMPLSDYERIVEAKSDYSRMSEKELLDSVERDIALWRAEHEDYEDYEDIEPFMPEEPWEMKKHEEQEPLPWESFDEAQDLQHEPLPWEEDEDEDFEEWKDKIIEDAVKEHEPIKYEDIPPPPGINIDDIMNDEKKKEEIIDMSFEDEDESDELDEFKEGDFMEEPIF